jgi:hypothetical protein
MTYTLYSNGVLEQDGIYLPIDENNPDFIAYQEWLAQGNAPTLRPASEYLAKLDDHKVTRQQLRTEYLNTITQLQAIENVTSPTNTQIITAIKFLARTIRLLLKLIARTI